MSDILSRRLFLEKLILSGVAPTPVMLLEVVLYWGVRVDRVKNVV